jgi:hypothetical protein
MGFGDPLRADSYDSDNIAVGRTTPFADPSAVYLGKLAEFEQMRRNVWLDSHGAHAVYVVGKRRSGKSYTLGVLCEGLAARSWLRLGPPDQAILLIDTLNIYGTLHVPISRTDHASGDRRLWQLPDERIDVHYIAPEQTRANIAAPSTRLTLDPAWLTLEDWCSFFEVDPFSDPLGHLLSVVLDAVQSRWTGAPDSPVATPSTGIGDLCHVLDRDPNALRFPDSTREALRRRLLALERFGFFNRPSTRVEAQLIPGRITVYQLRDLDERLRALVVGVLVREIMRARGRADAAARKAAALGIDRTQEANETHPPQSSDTISAHMCRCWIAIDEAHNYLPSSGNLPSRPVLRRLITEGRNIGLSVVAATQQPSGLDSSIQRNADALIVHSMSMRDDIAAAEAMLNTLVPDSATWGSAERVSGRVFEKIVRGLPQGYCILSTDTANRVFGVKVRPRITMHGGEAY